MEVSMIKRTCVFALLVIVLYWTAGHAQSMIMDAISNKVIQRYQQASCGQLASMKGEPKSPEQQTFIEKLKGNAELRQTFINKVAPPIANKMFECGLIP
jgi:hypothetical protein